MQHDESTEPETDSPGTPTRDARFVAWSIPKAEWDGYVARTQSLRPNVGIVMTSAMAAFWAVGCVLLFIFAFPTQPKLLLPMLGVGAVIFVPMGVIFAVMRRNLLRWRELSPQIWNAQGCLCPICLAPLRERADDPAGCGHGFIVEDQPWVVRYFEARATAPANIERQQVHGIDEMRALRNRAAKRGTQPRGFFRSIARSIRITWDAWLGFDQPMWRRVTGHIVLGMIIVIVIAPFSRIGAVVTLWICGFSFMGYRALRSANYASKRLHCAKCRQTLLSDDRTKCCPECGASLAEAGSVKSVDSKLLPVRWAMGVSFLCLGYWFPMYLAPMIERALPNDALFAIAERVPSIAPETLDILRPRPLTATEQRRLADLMLPHIAAWARRETKHGANDATYIAASVANGTLPVEYAELVAHAVCQLQVTASYAADASPIEERDGVLEVDAARASQGIRIRMRFIGFGGATDPQLGPTVGVLSTLELDDAPVWNAATSTPPILASDAVATLDLGMPGLPPAAGERRVVARAFVSIAPDYQLISAFDETGAPILPPKSLGPWHIERALALRVR